MNREQQQRKKVRDRKKRIEQAISSLTHDQPPDGVLSKAAIYEVAAIAHELNLGIIGLIALEALKVQEMQARINRLGDDADTLDAKLNTALIELKRAQDTIAKMNVRYVRRVSKKARSYHPEKRRG